MRNYQLLKLIKALCRFTFSITKNSLHHMQSCRPLTKFPPSIIPNLKVRRFWINFSRVKNITSRRQIWIDATEKKKDNLIYGRRRVRVEARNCVPKNLPPPIWCPKTMDGTNLTSGVSPNGPLKYLPHLFSRYHADVNRGWPKSHGIYRVYKYIFFHYLQK